MENYPDKYDKSLIQAIASLKTEKEIENFMRDLLTLSEAKELANRWRIAGLLWDGKLSYKEIAAVCKTSTTTVTRVNEYLRKHTHRGYQAALKYLQTQAS